VLGLRGGTSDDCCNDACDGPDNGVIASNAVEGGDGFSTGDGGFDCRRSCENCAARPRLAKRSLRCWGFTNSRLQVDTDASDALDTLCRCCDLWSNGQEATEKLSSGVSISDAVVCSPFWQLPTKGCCCDVCFKPSCQGRLNSLCN